MKIPVSHREHTRNAYVHTGKKINRNSPIIQSRNCYQYPTTLTNRRENEPSPSLPITYRHVSGSVTLESGHWNRTRLRINDNDNPRRESRDQRTSGSSSRPSLFTRKKKKKNKKIPRRVTASTADVIEARPPPMCRVRRFPLTSRLSRPRPNSPQVPTSPTQLGIRSTPTVLRTVTTQPRGGACVVATRKHARRIGLRRKQDAAHPPSPSPPLLPHILARTTTTVTNGPAR